MENKIRTALTNALEAAPKRGFTESVDLSFTIKDVDLKNPSNRIQEEIRLPKGRGKDVTIAMFATGEATSKASAGGINVIDPATIEDLGGDKMRAKKIANSHDFFLSEVPHMGLVGRYLGVVLGPRGKMPRPVPPTLDPAVLATGLRNTVTVRSRDRITFHTTIGTVEQSIDDLLENAMAVVNRVFGRLERGVGNIRSMTIKTTMGPSQAVEVIG